MRKTKVFLAVQALFEEAVPLSIPDIQKKLAQQGLHPNKTTLYRMLSRFCEEGMTKKVLVTEEMSYYERVSAPHGHFMCTQCETVQCLPPFRPENLINALSEGQDTFKITSSQLSFKGTCQKCC